MSPLSTEADSSIGTVAFGPYRILELIGAGGMAEVYRASSVDPAGGVRPLVIKRVKPKHAGDPSFIRMFVDEANLSAKLQHPNIVSVFEYGEIEGHHYIAMEYIDGLHLQAVHVCHMQLKQRPVPWQACALIARDVLKGLDYAHEKTDDQGAPLSLVHRDINLVNIMVGRTGRVKILDFGIVKAADGVRSAETVGGVLKGKFGYMSPEQAEGKGLDRRSDVFSASIVLHELLTGRRLFWGDDDLAILRKVCAGEVVDPRVYTPDLPEGLVSVLMKGLAKNREDRWPTAATMADALNQTLAEHGVSEGILQSLMEEVMPPLPSEASETMRQRRRRVTIMAWSAGVKDVAAPARMASGEFKAVDVQATTVGKRRTGVVEATLSTEETLILSEPRWLAPENAPEGEALTMILGEQDTTVVTGASVGAAAVDAATVILAEASGEAGAASGAETGAVSPSGGMPHTQALTGAETVLLASEASSASDPIEGAAGAVASPPVGHSDEDAWMNVDPAPESGRRLGRLALAALLMTVVAALVAWLVLRR